MSGETVYLGHDGIFRVQLQENGAGASLASVTKMTLSVGGVLIESTNQDTDPILWNKVGYQTGEVRFNLGGQSLTPGFYSAPLVVYDPTYTDGILWTNLLIEIVADPEAVAAS